jgi:hypothetical protein
MLRNLVLNLSKWSQWAASDHMMSINYDNLEFKEDDTIQQMLEDMDLVNQESLPTNLGLKEANNHHVFH